MHELAITQSMLELVLDQAKQAGASRVSKINLIIGEMCGYVEESVRFYFDFLSKGTPAEKAELVFNGNNSLCSWHRVTLFRVSKGTKSLGRSQG